MPDDRGNPAPEQPAFDSTRSASETAIPSAISERSQGLPTGIVDNISDGFVLIDSQWNYSYANHEAARLIGRPISSLLNQPLWDHFFDIEGKLIEEELRGVAKDRIAAEFEIYQKDARLWLSCKAYPVADGGIGIYLRDSSRSKRTQCYLEVAQAVTRILADSPTVALASKKIVETLCQCLEWDWGAFWDIDEHSNTLRCVEMWHAPTKRFPEFEATSRQMTFSNGNGLPGRIWKSATAVWIQEVASSTLFRAAVAVKEGLHGAFGFPVKSAGQIYGVLEFFSGEILGPSQELLNLTEAIGSEVGQFIERKLAEQELGHRTYLLKTVTDNASSMLYMIDVDDRATYVNPAVEQITGYGAEELIGQVMHEKIHHYHPDGTPFPIDDCPLSRALSAGGGRVRDYEDVFVRKDGTFFPVRCSASTIFRDGVRIGTVIDVQDVTAAKRAEKELQRLNMELENRVMERTAALRSAHIALLQDLEERKQLEAQLLQSQKLEGLGTLAGGVAHEFNNILNVIKSYISLLPIEGVSSKNSQDIEVVKQMVERGASLVRQLLSVSRRAEVKLDPVQINHVVKNLELVFNQTFPKTISISLNLDPNLPPIMADENQLSQALLNLGLNARDAMPAGGKLTVSTGIVAAGALRQVFPSATEKQYIFIAVSDTGDGFDPTIKSHIFEPFFTTKPPGKGTGLGLSVVYGIAANHGGFVEARSDCDEGAIFSVYLPVSDKSVTDLVRKPSLVEKAIGAGDTILFVEDEDHQLELMQRFLERRGYRVLVARDGASAVEIYIRHRQEIALVILDFGLPKLNGWEAFQRMRECNSELQAILATGYIPETIAVQSSQFCAVIMKPYSPNDVLVEILRVFNRMG